MAQPGRLPQEEFNEIFSKVPRLCVDLLVKHKEKIILTKRAISPWKGLWHLPGGGVKLHESIQETIKRIAKDELSITVTNPKILGYVEISSSKQKGYEHPVSLMFLVDAESTNITLDHQASEYGWFDNNIPEDMLPEHRAFIRDNNEKIFEDQ